MKALFTGGGTGGHIFPIVAIMREMKKRSNISDLDLEYMGPKDIYAERTLLKEGVTMHFVPAGKIRRYFSIPDFFANLVDLFIRIPAGIIYSVFLLFFIAPDFVFSKGGYGAIPVVIAARILRVPVFLHESDVSPGMANRFASKFCKQVFVSFPAKETEYFPFKKMIYVGNPIREELLTGNREKAKEIFSLNDQKPIVLFLGGSQGSQRINELVMNILPELLRKYEVIHQTGDIDYYSISREMQALLPEDLIKDYHIYAFLEEEKLKHAYVAADCVVARAGAGAIFEIAAFKKPSILIPLPEAAQNHQFKNAYAYADHRACIVLEEGNLTPNFFMQKLNNLFSTNLEAMRDGAERFSKPYAADVIARYLLDIFNT